jgi:hypothetical protein
VTRGIGTLGAVQTKWSAVVVCGVLLFAGACSDSGSAGPTPLAEKSAIISAGDSLCQQHNDAVKQVTDQFKSTHSSPSEADALDFYNTIELGIEDRTVGAIKRLGEPTKDKTEYDAAIKALDEALTAFKSEVSDDAVKVLTNGSKAFDDAKAQFKAYGYKVCGG